MILNPQSTGFDPANAVALARLAALAYRPAAEVKHDFERIDHPQIRGIKCITSAATGTQLFAAAFNDCLVIAFAGTQPRDIRDWITDLRFHRRRTEELRTLLDTRSRRLSSPTIHCGFLRAWLSVAKEVRWAIDSMRHAGDTPIFITGHSLGGALAVLCAHDLLSAIGGRPEGFVRCYTFGQPRVGNAAFAAHYNVTLRERTWRIVHEEDVVPRLPLWSMGFRHAGHEVFLPSFPSVPGGSSYLVNPTLATKLVSDVIGLGQSFLQGDETLIADHAIDRYVARLESLTSKES